MKTFRLLFKISVCLIPFLLQANTITLTFSGKNSQTQATILLQSVLVRNLTRGCDTTLYGGNPSIVMKNSLGINELSGQGGVTFTLMPVEPNPFNGSATVYLEVARRANLHLRLCNSRGIVAAEYSGEFNAGRHKFIVTGSVAQMEILTVFDGTVSKSAKLVNCQSGTGRDEIRYAGFVAQKNIIPAKSMASSVFVYHLGDSLSYTAAANGFYDETIKDVPVQNTSYTLQMLPVVLVDGFYVKGAVTAFPTLNPGAIMKVAINEVVQTPRTSLLELYIPIQAGSAGFNIVQVAGSNQVTFGPGSGFGFVTNPNVNEPTVSFQRGPCTETTAKWTVPITGMYHVTIDYIVRKVAIVPVHWGMIGAATPSGWGISTDMTESSFNPTSMSWSISNLTLLRDDWKFRYSNGWMVYLDTIVDLGGGHKGISVNTNFGGAVNALVPGGINIYNSDPGIYTCNLTYTVGSAYSATLIKIGSIPPVDYTNVQMGIIGDCYLKLDGTQANWDENFGTTLPAVAGTNYTWTYNINFIGYHDFKFRQGYDWSGIYIGYPQVTMAGPAASYFTNDGGNFRVVSSGNFTMVLKIEAATEIWTVTATKN